MSRDALKGSLDLLILRTLARAPAHGYAITCAILAASQNRFAVEEGSLYPALRRLEAAGLLKGAWSNSESGRRARVYTLTRAGRKRLAEITEEWQQHAAAISSFLEMA